MKPDPATLAWAEEQARTVERGPTRPYGEWRREMEMIDRVAEHLGRMFTAGTTVSARDMARAAIEAIERTHRLVPRHVSHIDAVCPECGTMGADHSPGCALSPSRMEPKDE